MGLAAWLWPIGFGGRMPVGGDVTRFAIGLMDVLRESYRAGRLPLWNDLWGFGFPGLAESQMGVYYPPHLLLYGLLPTEAAYTASLVFHTLWSGLGATWAARRFGISRTSAPLAGFAWAASGFFLIHLAHHWAATTGSWLPWALGLAWPLADGRGSARDALALAAVLTLQVLPGHFQLAFETQATLLGLALWGIVEHRGGWRRPTIGNFYIALAVLAVLPLGALQLLPTARLAELAGGRRDFEYLSGFAATPFHLVNWIAPGLFHRSPLWRPLAWDPFHTSPEEQLCYIGLVPLWLAFGALRRGWRADPAVRALGVLALSSLLLSFGPYTPGFSTWMQLPGFSFFRAPARWGLVTSLALALLSGRALDLLRDGTWPRPNRSLVRFAVASAVIAGLLVGAVELAFRSPGQPELEAPFHGLFGVLPWSGDPDFTHALAKATGPPTDSLIVEGLLRRGIDPAAARLDRDRWPILAWELGPTLSLLATLLLVGATVRRPRPLVAAIVLLTGADLLLLGHLDRPVETGPIRPLTSQSPVMARLAAQPRGSRALTSLGNLPMAAGAGTIPAYRTLDRPALESLVPLAFRPMTFDPRQASPFHPAMQALGATILVDDRRSTRSHARLDLDGRPLAPEVIDDPALTSWNYGRRFAESPPGRQARYEIWRPDPHHTTPRAWFLPAPDRATAEAIAATLDDARPILDLLRTASPLPWRSPTPERVEVEIEAKTPGYALITQLDDPEWRAMLTQKGGPPQAVPIQRLFGRVPGEAQTEDRTEHGAWQGVWIAKPGRYALTLTYEGRAARQGLAISGVAWSAWIVGYWLALRRSRRPAGGIEGGDDG